jgi:hypothetical protein
MTEVRERLRQAQFGYRRTPEELRELEQTISGIRRDPWQKPPHHLKATFDEELAGNDLLQGGGVLQELTRQACFGYARNEKGEQVRLSGAQLRERLREEIQADAIKKTTVAPVAQGASVSQG